MDRRTGNIDFVVQGATGVRLHGAFALRSVDRGHDLRVPILAEQYQKQRVRLEPGAYSVDFEPAFDALSAGSPQPPQAHPAGLPRLVVVAPASLTVVAVQLESNPDDLDPGPMLADARRKLPPAEPAAPAALDAPGHDRVARR